MYVSYKGGLESRAGTKFVGFSKQTGRDFPPRLIPFQFSINQGLALEFGDFYMRVISQGEYVTEPAVAIGGASNTNPAELTFGAQGATAAAPINSGVTFSYAPGDLITLDGGVFLSPAVLSVTTSRLLSAVVRFGGTGYSVSDTITLDGGVSAPDAVATVQTLVSVKARGTITFAANPANTNTITLNSTVWTFVTTLSGPNQTVIQDTLAETLFQLAADLNASADVEVVKCTYTASTTQLLIEFDTAGTGGNSYTIAASVATPSGGTLSGGTATAVGTVSITTPGVFTDIPPDGLMTQQSTSGGGTGATFQSTIFGPNAVAIANPGAYQSVPSNPVAQASTTGIGVGATFTMTWGATPAFSNDDWIFIAGVGGMTELNGNVYRVAGVTPTTVNLFDVYGDPIDATAYGAYTGGGLAFRIYTLDTPYAEEDLPYLKFTQSADVMTLCCVNQITGTEYAPQDLSRFSDIDWVFSELVPESSVDAPASATAAVSNTTGSTYYAYIVTAVSPLDATESVGSPIATAQGASILTTPNTQVNLNWTVVPEVQMYNIYKAQVSELQPVPPGSLFGYIGTAYGSKFVDRNYTPDFTQVPPRHQNPFAQGKIIGVTPISGGSGYNQNTVGTTITTSTGSGAIIQPVVQNGAVVAFIVYDAGQDYAEGDTIAVTGGTGAQAQLVVGPAAGTFPSVPGYFQQRRVLANTQNQPDTYWMSQPGAFTNFDSRLPTIDTDAIEGSPWSVQVNGIQALVQTPTGLLVMTGASAWMIGGSGAFATNVQPISPDSQVANPLPFTGCSPIVPPLKINFDVVYVTAKGSFYYELPYQGYAFTEANDLTTFATHLFVGYTVDEHCWCEQPSKLLWSVRDDGVLLSLTRLRSDEVAGWGRHDTNGYFESVCTVTEPPVDALYTAAKRVIGENTAYTVERMDNREWSSIEDVWAVDCALALAQPTPLGTLTVNTPTGLGLISGVTVESGGTGYSEFTTAVVIDQATDARGLPYGSGAEIALSIVDGVIVGVVIQNPGQLYRYPSIVITDPAAPAGGNADAAVLVPVLDNEAVFTSTSASFAPGDVGSVIRAGGGIAIITDYIGTTSVAADIVSPIVDLRPDTNEVSPQPSGQWTMTPPIMSVSGLTHLAGAVVTGLADGNIITPREVSANGVVTLDDPASDIVIGLGFTAQAQSVYLDGGTPTVQGQRKKIGAVSVLVRDSRDIEIGANQVDGSTLSPKQIAPEWVNMTLQPNQGQMGQPPRPYNGMTDPLYTSWVRDTTITGFKKNGQVALQQRFPVPLSIISIVPEVLFGDTPSQTMGGGKE